MSILHYVDQYSDEWWRARRGIPTASQFHRVVTPATCKPSTQARGYMYRLIAERLLGETLEENPSTKWMEHGEVTEAAAIEAFQKTHELTLERVGLVTTDDGRLGCSPDCLVKGSVEAVEIKCPAPWTQIGYLLDGPGTDYQPQVQGHLLVGEWDCVHFFAFHPRMPAAYRRTDRNENYINTMKGILMAFCDALDAETERARRLGPYTPADLARVIGEDTTTNTRWMDA